MPSEKKEAFLRAAEEQVRCRRARPLVLRELAAHIEDREAACRARGMDEAAAEEEAVRGMGDPYLVGQQLDAVHRPKPAWAMLGAVLLLALAGLAVNLVILSASPGGFPVRRLCGYLLWMGLGAGVLSAFYFLDFSIAARRPKICYALVSLAALAGTLPVPGNGRRIYVIPPAMFLVPLFAAAVFLLRGRRRPGVFCCGALVLAPIAVTWGYLAKDGSFMLVYGLTCLTLLTAAVFRGWFGGRRAAQALVLYGGLWCGLWFCWNFCAGEELRDRLLRQLSVWRRLEMEPWGSGYAARTLRNLLGGARWIGHTRAGYDFTEWPLEKILPGWDGGCSLAYLTARFGWLAGLALLAVLAVFLFFLYRTAFRTRNRLGSMVSLSVALLVSAESALYILNNLGLILPAGPFMMPFLTAWGPALAAHCGLLGLAASCFRRQEIVRDPVPAPHTWEGRRVSAALEGGRLTVSIDFSRHKDRKPARG